MNKIYRNALIEIFSLKKIKRTGWLLPGRNLNEQRVESVSDHTWASCMLAEMFLPATRGELIGLVGEEQGDDKYDKTEIVRMLIVHDLSEAYTGDVALGCKTDKDRELEEARMAYYATLAKYSPFENMKHIYRRWEKYEERTDYNAKVAKDIDQLECFIQLFMYKDMLIEENGETNWLRLQEEWEASLTIRTRFGKWLYCFIKKNLFG